MSSVVPTASIRPSGLNASARARPPGTRNRRISPVAAFQSATVPGLSPRSRTAPGMRAAIHVPSGLIADLTIARPASKLRPVGSCDSTSQRCTTPSALPAASVPPSPVKATPTTGVASSVASVASSRRPCTSQSRTAPAASPTATIPPLGENATLSTWASPWRNSATPSVRASWSALTAAFRASADGLELYAASASSSAVSGVGATRSFAFAASATEVAVLVAVRAVFRWSSAITPSATETASASSTLPSTIRWRREAPRRLA